MKWLPHFLQKLNLPSKVYSLVAGEWAIRLTGTVLRARGWNKKICLPKLFFRLIKLQHGWATPGWLEVDCIQIVDLITIFNIWLITVTGKPLINNIILCVQAKTPCCWFVFSTRIFASLPFHLWALSLSSPVVWDTAWRLPSSPPLRSPTRLSSPSGLSEVLVSYGSRSQYRWIKPENKQEIT